MIINLFCDASINIDKKVACGGCYITCQNENGIQNLGFQRIIQTNATNNSAEILAIWVGVIEAIKIKHRYPNAVFRLFSDSKISLYGLRDWMKNWIARMNPDGVLIASNGQPVMNQERFIDIFNLIVENNLHIELYHQRGHVKDRNMSSKLARAHFIKANKVPPENLGLDIEYISDCNDIIDNLTRQAIREYLETGVIPFNTTMEAINPMIYRIRDNCLHQYIRCINKTSVKSYHDFKGGYNQ